MRKATFSERVHAPAETVWKLLLDKIEHPENYVPGVRNCRIVERFEDGVLREMSVGGMEVRERVTVTPEQQGGEVVYTLVDHPMFSGRIVNRVVSTSVQSPVAPVMLTFEYDWVPVDPASEKSAHEDMSIAIQHAVKMVKDKAEEMDAQMGAAASYTLNADESRRVR